MADIYINHGTEELSSDRNRRKTFPKREAAGGFRRLLGKRGRRMKDLERNGSKVEVKWGKKKRNDASSQAVHVNWIGLTYVTAYLIVGSGVDTKRGSCGA